MRKCQFNPKVKCNDIARKCDKCNIRRDIGQKLLTPEPPKKLEPIRVMEMNDIEVTCPYCLFTARPSKFQIKIKKGYSEKRFKCPECSEGMLRDTLFKERTVTEFAEWVLENSLYGFWKRARAGVFMQRLKDMGIANEFWTVYKQKKSEIGKEKTYSDRLDEEQEEARQRWEGEDRYDAKRWEEEDRYVN